MISKLAPFALLGAASAALISDGGVSNDATFKCFQCLANGNNYCALQTTYASHASITQLQTTGDSPTDASCTATDSDCTTGTGTLISSNALVELGQLQCPTDQTICGSDDMKTLEGDTDSVTFTPGTVAQYDGCNWIVKATCGAPMYKTTATTVAGKRALFHYTKDSRTIDFADNSADPAEATLYPSTDASVHNPADYEGSKVTIIEGGGEFVSRLNSESTDITTAAYLTEVAEYYQKVGSYQADVITAQDEFTWFVATFSWIWFQYKPKYPDYVGVYSGTDWTKLTSQGGWGDLTILDTSVNPKSHYPYGIAGDGVADSANADIAVDINTANCVDRYVIITSYASDDATMPPATVSVGGWLSTLDLFNNPAAPTNPLGAIAKTVGIATALVAALY